jgi:uncharacterized protein YuzE
MRVEYNQQVDAAYIYFDVAEKQVEKTYACDPAEIGGQIQLDFDETGKLIGIEVLNASKLLPAAMLKVGSTSI